MNNSKVVKIDREAIEFNNGIELSSYHDKECCEQHYLSFEHISMDDFCELEFDLSSDNFFNKIEGYGIELIPIVGNSVKIPGYGSNNGYYSTDLTLILQGIGFRKEFDISECQEIDY